MTVQQLIEADLFTLQAQGDTTKSISKIFCCDLLSIAMSKAPADAAWVTVMGNRNTLAVASLADVSCIILAEGVCLSPEDLSCACLRQNFPSLTRDPGSRSTSYDPPVL